MHILFLIGRHYFHLLFIKEAYIWWDWLSVDRYGTLQAHLESVSLAAFFLTKSLKNSCSSFCYGSELYLD